MELMGLLVVLAVVTAELREQRPEVVAERTSTLTVEMARVDG
jgi:hypothetical protein